MKVLAISEKELARGFALAGIDTCVVLDAKDASQVLEETILNRQYGIVIIDEKLSDGLDKHVKKLLSISNGPMLVPIPGELKWCDTEMIPHDEYAANLIRRAVGYQLNIRL